MNDETKIIIADDHPIFRRGLRQVIEDDARLKVVGDAADGFEALNLIENLAPDIAVIDGQMPQMGGLELARTVKEKNLPVSLIFLTMYRDEDIFNAAMDAGVRGYVLKDNAVADITHCIKAVENGQIYITPTVSHFLLNRSRRAADFAAENPSLQSLTKAERRILRFIAEEKTSREIGEILFIHPRTVNNHRTNICQKLNVHGSNALLRFALKHKSELAD